MNTDEQFLNAVLTVSTGHHYWPTREALILVQSQYAIAKMCAAFEIRQRRLELEENSTETVAVSP